MPIFFEKEIDTFTRLGVWKIEEGEDFFVQKAIPHRPIPHPHKRLQHLAGRYLLQYLFPDFPLSLIQIADTKKPYLEGEAYHFSISHCGDFAAAIVSKIKRVGVDVEQITPKVARVQHKFVSEEESKQVNSEWSRVNGERNNIRQDQKVLEHKLLTLLWSCKESVFKWYGWGEVDFKEHIHIKSILPAGADRYAGIVLFQKNEELFLNLQAQFLGDLCLSYVMT